MKKQIAGRHDINIDSQNNKTKSSSHSKKREVTDDDDIGNLEVGQTSVGKPIQTGAAKPMDSKSLKAKLLTSKVAKLVYLD